MNEFSISEIMFMRDIMIDSKREWVKIGDDKDVINEYDSIILKIENRIKDYHGFANAMDSLIKTTINQKP